MSRAGPPAEGGRVRTGGPAQWPRAADTAPGAAERTGIAGRDAGALPVPRTAKRVALPRTLQHPTRLVPLAFLLAVALGTCLLMLPAARAGEGAAPFLTALFTATSAVCVTGPPNWNRTRIDPCPKPDQ